MNDGLYELNAEDFPCHGALG